MKKSEIIQLAKDTFGAEPGASWLRHAVDDVGRELFSPEEKQEPSTNRIIYRAAQYDFIQRLTEFVNMPVSLLSEIREIENKAEKDYKDYLNAEQSETNIHRGY